MPVSVSDPRLSIRDLLDANWDNTNTSISEDPEIHTGWYNSSWAGRAQVTLTDPDENNIAGGQTGYSGISGAGEGLKIMVGNIDVGCWATKEMYDSVNPKQLAFDLSEEVKRIVLYNTFAISDLEWITWNGRREIVNSDADPVLFRYDCTVRYEYFADTAT